MRHSYIILFVAPAMLICGCARISPPAGVNSIEKSMLTTGYCSCGKCCGWERNWCGMPVISSGPRKGKPKIIGQTASGTKAKKGTIGADTSVYPFGTIMYVPGYGYGRVEDRGGAVKGEHIDLYFRTHAQAKQWGSKRLPVKVWYKPGSRRK